MTLQTSVVFKLGPYGGAKENVRYELEFFTGEKYQRTHTLQYEDDTVCESGRRLGVPDIELKVKKIETYPLEPGKIAQVDLMTMTFTNPDIGTPTFTYDQPKARGGGSEDKGFDVNDQEIYVIKAAYFGSFYLSVQRIGDGGPCGGGLFTPETYSKNWTVVFGHNI